MTKRPYHEFGGEVQFTGGAWDLYEGAFDVNAPLFGFGENASVSDAKGLAVSDPNVRAYARLVGLYKDSGSFVDYAGAERIYVAPSFLIEWGEDTSLTILTSFREDFMDLAYALPAVGTVLPSAHGDIPLNRYLGNPDLGNNEWERTIRLGYEFKHRFNDNLSFRQSARYYWVDWYSHHLSYPSDLQDRLIGLSGFFADGNYQGWRVDNGVDIKFDTGPAEHLLTVGVDYRTTETTMIGQDSIDLVYLDLYNPDYKNMARYQYGPHYYLKDTDGDFGIYLQEHAKIGRFTATLGGRWDFSNYDNNFEKYTEDAFTPKAGLTYEVAPGAAIYGNYSRSFNPQWFSTDAAGAPVGPEEGENWEAGLKYQLPHPGLGGMLAVYQLTRQNVATADLTTPDPFDSVVTGEQRARGFEWENFAQLTPGLRLSAAYTYIDAEVVEDNDLLPGTRLLGVPEHMVNAWLKYTLQNGPLRGFGAGVGGRYLTSQAGDLPDSFELPAYGILDAALYYEKGNLEAQVNFGNVLDRRHFVGSYDELYVLPGEPFNVTASVTVRF